MDKKFKPQEVEEKIYQFWEEKGYFSPEIDPKKKPFVLIMPPPNANAPLHVGHGLVITVEDIMVRYHRMLGQPTLYLPGSDHASIATQVSFEKKLTKRGRTRYDLGRKKFFAEAMKFTLNNKKTIENQTRMMGASCDWTRNSFTLDPKFDKPVYTTFKKLYDDGLIYRAERIINWCLRCETALSDLEVEHKETKSKLWYIRYPLKERGKSITVATTRPETMLGDTAVAVNTKDRRYKNLVGKTAILPLMNREIPIIADGAVDPEFGTGAVKVTPAHDPIDFEIGQKHKLETTQVIGFDGKMTKNTGRYRGLDSKEAREKILADLEKLGLMEKEENYTHSVGRCERCKAVIEPLVSTQWFIEIKPLAQPAIKVVKEGKIRIIPQRFEKIYFNWMENIKDWCISRQLWWGHQMPVWYCLDCGKLSKNEIEELHDKKGLVLTIVKREIYSKLEPIVSIDELEKCPKCGSSTLYRDPDTLDTWFSSGQWPFNTLGWPKKTRGFQYFYPTTVMETGYEILFFWVARMIMLGLYATGEIPFETVYLHGMVRDVFGKKMSKSRPETCIDPLEAVEEYGADALRMALIMGNTPGTDSSLSKNKIRGMRNFANKIWNAARFTLASLKNVETDAEKRGFISANRRPSQCKSASHPDDKWILEELNKVTKETIRYLESYRFDLAAENLYHFFWHTFCDKYIEAVKPRLTINNKQLTINNREPLDQDRNAALAILTYTLITSLKLLHPFMPFVTEEIWQRLREQEGLEDKLEESIMIAEWPANV